MSARDGLVIAARPEQRYAVLLQKYVRQDKETLQACCSSVAWYLCGPIADGSATR